MSFGKLIQNSKKIKGLVFLGAPEAEAEALPNSKLPLSKVYKDYSNLIHQLANEKFIIIGRKGAGKSAFAENICDRTKNSPNIFTRFIRQEEANLERIVQIGKENGHQIERENLYKWLIYTNILKLFTQNSAAQESNEYNLLKQFINKNSGYINISESEVTELIKKEGFEISIEYLKRFFTSKLKKDLEIKQEKAPFYKLLPHLREVILKVLLSPLERQNNNSYILFFDDLDIGFDANNNESVSSLVSLLRVSKEINNEFFAKNNLESKVVILLREDICKKISLVESDTAKLLTSYAATIKWYQDEYHNGSPETNLNLRKFINDRIQVAFTSESLQYNYTDPWESLVEDPFRNSEKNDKSSFKYILDHTFFRPRDLLLFFKPLSIHKYNFPLSKQDVNSLIGNYCEEVISEIKNEFSCFYSTNQINGIFSALGEIANLLKPQESKNVLYETAIEIIRKSCPEINPEALLEDLFSRSLLGGMGGNNHVYFKHREPSNDIYELNKKNGLIMHSALRVYCQNKGYM